MYRKKNLEKQAEEVKISLEAPVPQNHILTNKAVNELRLSDGKKLFLSRKLHFK